MVIFVMGTDRCERSSLARMLAITLGWEFADADELPPTYVSGASDKVQCRTNIGTLSAALQYWVYNWHDVIVSCPELSEQNRQLLGRNLPIVKFIYLRSPEHGLANQLSEVENGSASLTKSNRIAGNERVLTIDASRRTKEIIAEIVAVLVLKRRAVDAVAS